METTTRSKDTDGIPYEPNECHIIVQKSKPKGTGQLGLGVLYFDFVKSAYFEYVAGVKYYAGEYYESLEYKNIKGLEVKDKEPF